MTDTLYAAQGYAVEPIFAPQVVEAARADIAEQIDRLCHALYLPFAESCPDAPLGARLDRLWQSNRAQADLLRKAVCTDAHRGPRLQALAEAPELFAAAERLAGRPLAGSIARVRASLAVFPEHLHEWHSDVAIDDGTSCGRVWITAWIPLGDAGPGNGGLELVPGRRAAPFEHRQDRGYAIDESELAGRERISPFCKAGEAIFLDRFTPHRSLPVTADARFALVVWMKAA